MAVLVTVAANTDEVDAENLNQVIELLQGIRNIPVVLTGANDPANYALSVKNAGTGGKGLVVYASDGTTILLQAQDSGVRASASGATAAPIVTTTDAQTLAAKTLSAPVLTGTVDVSAATLGPMVNGALTRFTNNLSVDSAASGTQLLFDQSGLTAGAKYWVSFSVAYTSAGAAGTLIGAAVEDAAPGVGLILAEQPLRDSWAMLRGSGVATVGSGGHLALYLNCNGTSGTVKLLASGLFATGVATYFHGIRVG